MKKPQPDLEKITTAAFLQAVGNNRKLRKLWGTTTVGGVEVLNSRRYHYKDDKRPSNFKKLFKYLGMYDELEEFNGKGVDSAWIELNRSLGSLEQSDSVIDHRSFVRQNLNSMWWNNDDGVRPENLTLTTRITVKENIFGVKTISTVFNQSKSEIADYVLNNYEHLWDKAIISQDGVGIINKGTVINTDLNIEVPDEDDLSPNDPWLATIARYALKNGSIPCTIKDVEKGLDKQGNYVNGFISLILEIPYYEFSTADSVVQNIANDLEVSTVAVDLIGEFPNDFRGRGNFRNRVTNPNQMITRSDIKKVYFSEVDEAEEIASLDSIADYYLVVTRNYEKWLPYYISSIPVEINQDAMWVVEGDIHYLKADVITSPKSYGLTHRQLLDYLFGLFDSGYKKSKVPWWKKLIAIIVFVIVVVVSFVSAGTLSGPMAILYAAATAILYGSLALVLLMLASSALGATEWAMAFAWASKTVEPLVTVATIIMVIDIINKGVEMVAKTIAADRALDIALDEFGDLGKIIKDVMLGNTIGVAKTATRVVNTYTRVQLKKLEKISDKNKDLKTEYDKLVEETEMDTDVMRGYMNIYAKPATADWSIFASTYDLPYERGGGILSTGNIQRTTKQAIRKADYEDQMFRGFNFV